jgi:hypothetical protein
VTDNIGQADTVYRNVYSESTTAALEVVTTVPGRVLAVDTDRILYVDSTSTGVQTLRIRNRSSGTDVTVSADVGNLAVAALMPDGNAVYLSGEFSMVDKDLFEWRDGALTNLGKASDLQMAGPFILYSGPAGLVRRNVSTGSSLTVTSSFINAGRGVAADGDVIYTKSDSLVYRFQDGTGSAPISPPIGNNTWPVTDGSSIVYGRRTGVTRPAFNNIIEIELFDGTNTIALVPPTESVNGLGHYTINNGWVAFTKPGSGGQPQVWTRSPGGQERQATFLGQGSGIVTLGPNGEIVSYSGANYSYVVPPYDSAPIDAGAGAGRFLFLDGALLKLTGNTVFRVGS